MIVFSTAFVGPRLLFANDQCAFNEDTDWAHKDLVLSYFRYYTQRYCRWSYSGFIDTRTPSMHIKRSTYPGEILRNVKIYMASQLWKTHVWTVNASVIIFCRTNNKKLIILRAILVRILKCYWINFLNFDIFLTKIIILIVINSRLQARF